MDKSMRLLLIAGVLASPAALAKDCSEVDWNQDVLDKYPSVANACQEVLEQDGKTYVKLAAEFVRFRQPNHATVDVREADGSTERLSFKVNSNATVNAGGKDVSWEMIPKGYDLAFYVPSDRFEIHQVLPATEEILIIEVEEPAELPKTASLWPAFGLAGGVFLMLGQFMAWRRRGQ
ncbi:hypothetical protein [Shewanella violacea]|nr:hypothetical protein [Shewanella violacea]